MGEVNGSNRYKTMNPSEYKPEYCQLAEDYIAKGHAMESFASQVNVSRQTVYNWKEAHPEFKEALDRGFSKRQALLETMLMKCAYTGEGNVTALIFLGKNWAGLRDKFEQDITTNGKDINRLPSEVQERIDALFNAKTE
jgi:predicted DNA-binding protein YlxM (UPF0122 family)